MSCSVILLARTPSPDVTVAAAARLCYSDVSAVDLVQSESAEKVKGLLRHLRKSGHFSPFEHASFTFAVDGLSRVASHQLVRHRIASFSQQSQRYVSMTEPDVIVPPSIEADEELRSRFAEAVRDAHGLYTEMVARGIPKEDARFILPHGWSTRLVMTMNARELHHFFTVRLCRRAQWEIRALARKMLLLVREEAPLLFDTAGPPP
ncbi:MAG TPA: FAD-dependent thymidylate synthase, partial [Synergistaceae bacterium]|nr:FAD-dependent thymidylate synthase [Synergistaceae bacterium]